MDKVKRQVAAARRRLVAQQFLGIMAWSLFATMSIAVAGLAVPKFWVVPFEAGVWTWSWLGAGIGVGLLIALAWTWVGRRSAMDAAIELDRRCGLKERVSSILSLTSDQLHTEIGQALLQDAIYRVERVDIRGSFAFGTQRRTLLPLVPALLGVLVCLTPNAVPDRQAAATASQTQQSEQVQRSARKLRDQMDRVEKKAQEEGLQDADALFRELRKGLEELVNRPDVDHQRALVKMNDLAKSLQDRRDRMGGADQIRDQLNRLKDVAPGPAERVAQAMQGGDFQKAIDELRRLHTQLNSGRLSEEERQQLERQLEQIQNRLQQLHDSHAQAQRDLEHEIQRRQAAGDLEGAGHLQRQLDQLHRLDEPMDALQKLARQLGQCRECLQTGDAREAPARLDQMAESLQELQRQADQRQTLQRLLDDIAMAKQAMGCRECDGQGCGACLSQFHNRPGEGSESGFGLGEGQAPDERLEARTDAGFYESRVKGHVQPGQAVRVGTAGGPNQPGQTLRDVRDQLQSSLRQEADPLTDLRLPKKEREHTRDYFRRYREGN